jgi:hypothetical protein
MLVVGVKPGEGVRIGDVQVLLDNDYPDRHVSIINAPPGRVTVCLNPTRTRIEFARTEVILWKTKGSSAKMGINTGEHCRVERIRQMPDGEIVTLYKSATGGRQAAQMPAG